MPRAEIPESVQRFIHEVVYRGRIRSEMHPDPLGLWLNIEDLPKLYQHWLEQLKEELLSEETRLLVIQAINTGVHHGLEPPVLDNVAGVSLGAACTSIEHDAEVSRFTSAPPASAAPSVQDDSLRSQIEAEVERLRKIDCDCADAARQLRDPVQVDKALIQSDEAEVTANRLQAILDSTGTEGEGRT